jgi:phosphoglycolate phosphatase-like HAD superfamily hydrolase
VVATSAGGDELDELLRQAGIYDLIEKTTSSSDAESSKPDPDIIQAALKKGRLEPRTAIMLGDTPYDIEAAGRAGVRAIALRCGGWWDDAALKGAVGIYDDPAALRAGIDRSPLVGRP